MSVYNYFRARFADGETPVDDAPRAIVAAIERWLADRPARGGLSVTVGELAEPALTLLVLRSGGPIAGAADPGDLVHVVAVADRRLGEAPPKALRQLFESLYGGELSRSLPGLRAELAGLRQASAAPEVLRRFATDVLVDELPWEGGRKVQRLPQSREPSVAAPRPSLGSVLGTAVVGAFAVLIGVFIAPVLAVHLGAPGNADADAELLGRLEALENRIDGLASQLHDDAANHQLELALIGRTFERTLIASRSETPVLEPDVAAVGAVAPPAGDALAGAPAIEVALASPPEPRAIPERKSPPPAAPPPTTDASVSGPTVARASSGPLPEVAAPPPDSLAPRFRVRVSTARVRAGPSSFAATRGLLAEGARIVGRSVDGEWIEIEPPPDFAEPTWIHASLVEERR